MNENMSGTIKGHGERVSAAANQGWTQGAGVRRTALLPAAFLAAAFGVIVHMGVVRQASAHVDPPACLFNGPSTSISAQGVVAAEHGDKICYIVGIANNCAGCCNVTGLNANLKLPNGAMIPITANATVNQGDSFSCPSADPRCVAASNCTIPATIGYQYVLNHGDERGQTGSGCPIVPDPGTGTVWASISGLGVVHISATEGTANICQSIPVAALHACCEPCTVTCTPVQSVSECLPPSVFIPVLDCNQAICNPLICNDNEPCTTDSCVPGTGCVFTPTVCNDNNNQCTTDVCVPGTGCTFTPIVCDDGQACTIDTCNPATGCVFTPTLTCDDGNACTTDVCVPGVGCVSTPILCDDNNACTTEVCDPGTGCVITPRVCEDGNECTFDFCDPATGCVFPPIPPCDDGDLCTTDACDPGRGCVFAPIACSDGNFCTDDSCNPDGSCTHTNNTRTCADDGLGCTDDVCNGGTCTHVLSLAGTICRNSVNACDPPEICDGSSNLCPSNFVITSCINDDDCCPLGCNYTNDNDCIDRVSVTEKGSIIYFSKIEIKWDSLGRLTQDTFLSIVNDYPADVFVQWYFINGDAPTNAVIVNGIFVERAHRGWNWADCTTFLSHDETTYMSAARGLPLGCQPFTVLDAGSPPGRPDLDGAPGDRILRGYAIAFAVDNNGHEISWNHLSGHVDLVNYLERSAWEYNGYALQCVAQPIPGQPCGVDHILDLNGIEYDFAFDKLVMDFYAVGSFAFSPAVIFPGGVDSVLLDTDLTLYPVGVDLRQDNDGPISTKAKFDIWNQNEDGFSGTTRCITCWDQTLLSNYGSPNHFLIDNIHTDKGKARIDGLASDVCDPPGSCCDLSSDIDCYPLVNHPAIDSDCSVPAALLGVTDKLLYFSGPGALRRRSDAGMTLVGQGTQTATIKWDVITPPQPLSSDDLNPRLENVLDIDDASLTPIRQLDRDENSIRPRKE